MKVAICGAWHVHAKGYAKHALEQNCEIVGVFERDDKLREAFLKLYDVPVFATLDELLASDAEGVIVCSASSDHTEDMVRIAEAKKDIFTEKVLALTDEECLCIERAVKENGVKFVISLFQKSLTACRAVKMVADSGELGHINYARFRNCHSGSVDNWLPKHFYNAKECGGGAMIDLGAHGMYLLHWLLGMPEAASSAFTLACLREDVKEKNCDNVEDNAVTVMRYKDGTIALNETGFVSKCSPVVFEVYGEQGYVRMEGNEVYKCTIATEKKHVKVELPEKEPLPIVQFLTNDIREGYGMEEAKALTHMMVMAYEKPF